ncbi:Tetratricopeptide repeat protein [uncultured archaeon]|nr:Tetratricopeptide repeat protein [uncultured archaeon]
MQKSFRTAIALSFALAVSVPVPNAFARSDTKTEQAITSVYGNVSKEDILKTDGLMREHAARVTAGCKTPMEVAKRLLEDIGRYKNGTLTVGDITANSQRAFYLKRGFCSSQSYLFIALFNECMKSLGLKAEARLCEIYRNSNSYLTIPHVAVAVTEGDHTVIFDPALNRVIDRRVKPIAARVLGDNGVVSNHLINLAAVADGKRDHAKAEAYARKAVAIEPKSAFAHCVLAQYLAENGKLEEARTEAETVIKLAPTWPNGYTELSHILDKLGLTGEEFEVLHRKVRVMPKESLDYKAYLKEIGYRTD